MRAAVTLLLAVLVTACQGSRNDSWFPLVEGSEQVYEVKVTSEEAPPVDEWTLRVEGPRTINDRQVMVRHHSAGVGYFIQSDESGVRRVATQMDIDSEPTPDKEPPWVLKAPYEVGTEWTTTTVPYLILRRNEHPRELRYSHKALMYWRIEAVDDRVTTPTGSHQPCLRVVGRANLNLFTDPVNGFTDVPLTSREWYCKGKGLVKFERDEPVPNGFLVGGSLKAEWVR